MIGSVLEFLFWADLVALAVAAIIVATLAGEAKDRIDAAIVAAAVGLLCGHIWFIVAPVRLIRRALLARRRRRLERGARRPRRRLDLYA